MYKVYKCIICRLCIAVGQLGAGRGVGWRGPRYPGLPPRRSLGPGLRSARRDATGCAVSEEGFRARVRSLRPTNSNYVDATSYSEKYCTASSHMEKGGACVIERNHRGEVPCRGRFLIQSNFCVL